MIDNAAYIGMNGAQTAMHKLQIITNNLANINSTGFRADYDVTKPYQVTQNGMQTRIYAKVDSTYSDFKKAPTFQTDRDLDIALAGNGFIAVQSKSGQEGYTRAGSLDIDKSGNLVTVNGEYVLGQNGIINIPQAEKITIAQDGTISAKLLGESDVVTLNRIKLTNPDVHTLKKGEDGLFYTPDKSVSPVDPNARIVTGSLEGSNVNAIDTLTQLIDLSRSYEIHTNLLKTFSDNAGSANKLLDLPR